VIPVSNRPAFNTLVLAAALCIGAGPYVVRAAGTGRSADSSPIANIDMQRVYEESEARLQAEERVKTYSVNAFKNFDETTRLQFQSASELEEFSRAINADKPTDADTKKLAAIRAADASRAQEFAALSAKPQAGISAQDKQRLKELTTMMQQRPVLLDRLQKYYQEAVDEEAAKQRRAGFAEVRATVQKLAKDQGFTQVYDVTALVYAPNDMTDSVIRKVKPKKP
jgi:Skp family chaperone for outer membrane proteins